MSSPGMILKGPTSQAASLGSPLPHNAAAAPSFPAPTCSLSTRPQRGLADLRGWKQWVRTAEGPAEHCACSCAWISRAGVSVGFTKPLPTVPLQEGQEGQCARAHMCAHTCVLRVYARACVCTQYVCECGRVWQGVGWAGTGRLAELRSSLTCALLRPYLPPTCIISCLIFFLP